MDPTMAAALAAQVVIVLTPALAKMTSAAVEPIVTGGEELVTAMGHSAGEHVAGLFKAVWNKFQGNPSAKEAVDDLAKAPQDEDAQAALRVQLKKALAADESFRQEVRALLEQVQAESARGGTTVVASGKGAVAAGRDIKGTVFTGDISGSDVKPGG